MGSIILCHKKKARQPYEITRIHRLIYTMEELCYYLCSYLYLVDYTIMNEKLCDWLEQELDLAELAASLRQNLNQSGSPEQFVITILAHSSIYTMGELQRVQDLLDKLKNQKPVEKQKHKADSLLKSGGIRQAISIYQAILQERSDDSVEKSFYGKVYACLGAAYGRLFLYREAAEMYEKAYEMCGEKAMLKSYLYACRNCMPKPEYDALVQKNATLGQMHLEILEAEQDVCKQVVHINETDHLEEWKEQYRKHG